MRVVPGLIIVVVLLALTIQVGITPVSGGDCLHAAAPAALVRPRHAAVQPFGR